MNKTRKSLIALILILALLTSALTGTAAALPETASTARVYLSDVSSFQDSIEGESTIVKETGMSVNGNIRTYDNAFYIDGKAPTVKADLQVATDYIQIQARGVTGLGPYQGNWIGAAGVYEFEFDADGVAVAFRRLLCDPYIGYSILDDATVRIGQFGAAEGDIHNTYKYNADTKIYIIEGSGAEMTLTIYEQEFDDLGQDENDIISVFYDYKSMTDRTLTDVFITQVDEVGTRPDTFENRSWSEGVSPSDPKYGYDAVENPDAVSFSLYDPIVSGDKPDDVKYPLVVFFHGNGGYGADPVTGKQDVASAATGYNYVTKYNDEFETNTPGVNGAFVMAARAVASLASPADRGGQSWLNGYRYDSNPRYAAGDAAYKGKPTQQAALLANIEWLLDTYENIDPNRVYLISHSAGGYMVIQTLFEAARLGKDDLIAGAVMHKGAFFPSGSQLADDYSEVELGLEDKLLSIKHIPLWAVYSLDDNVCSWANTAGDKFRMQNDTEHQAPMVGAPYISIEEIEALPNGTPMNKIGGALYLWEAIGNLKNIGGASDLTRFSALVAGAHGSAAMDNNNQYPESTAQRSGVSPKYYTSVYGTMPEDEGFDLMNPTPKDTDEAELDAYTFGIHPQYSTDSYEETFVSWLNKCGNAKANPVKEEVPPVAPPAEVDDTPEEPAAGEFITYVVVAGDSLTRISTKLYETGARWREIYDLNREVIGGNPDVIYPGQVLKVKTQ